MTLLFPRIAFPDTRAAVTVDGRSLDYAGLADAAASHAADLTRRGIIRGDRVGVVAHGTLDTMAAIVGNASMGVLTVPINPRLGTTEFAHVMADSAPRVVYADSAIESAAAGGLSVGVIAPIRIHDPAPAVAPRAVDDAPLLVLYTSGTTGAPKGAVITARNVATNIDGLARAWRWTDADTVVHSLPLFHVHGLVLGLFGCLRVGASLTHVPRFEPGVVADALMGASMLFAVPTMYHRLVEAAEATPSIADAMRRARLLVSGSAALTLREHRRIEAVTGRGVHERYGLTESLIACAIPADAAPRPGYVGPPVPGVEVALVDDDRNRLDARDDATIGEIAIRGPSVFLGYLNRDDATHAVVDEAAWFYSGDLATRTGDGYFRIVGRRATDLIKTGGYKVGAGEVEACLLEHPAVRECAVLGQLDDDLGERIVAHVVLDNSREPPSERDLIAFVGERLAPHKRPRSVVFADALPRNAMGKVMKQRLTT